MGNARMMNAINAIVAHTDNKIREWYVIAKQDYNVKGSGKTHYNKKENKIVVEFTENGEQKQWSMAFYPHEDYVCNGMDWVFNCWMALS